MKNIIKVFILIGFLGWFSKHFLIFPTFNDEDRDISGFEFRLRF